LLGEFKAAPPSEEEGLGWAVASALETVADDSVFDEIAALATDRRYGKSRRMLALSLGNMTDPRAVDVLLDLLNDEEVAAHAVMGLGKLKAKKAAPKIEPFLEHPRPWVRREAKKALARIQRAPS
jgi:HEAT repeat protein